MLRTAAAAAAVALAAGGIGCKTSPVQPAAASMMTPITVRAEDGSVQWGGCPPIFPAGCQIAVLQGDPGRPNADVFLRVPGGQDLPAHSHTSAERMVLVTGELRVQYRGAQPAVLTPGEYAYGPAGLPHKATCASAAPCTLFIAFEGPVDAHAFDGPMG